MKKRILAALAAALVLTACSQNLVPPEAPKAILWPERISR